MSIKAFLKRCLIQYFIITTCVTVAIAVLGMSLDPESRFGYEAFFSPLIFAFISLLPSIVLYSRKELPFRRMLVRKVLQIILLEAMLIAFGLWTGILHSIADTFFFALAVLVVYLAVSFIEWHMDRQEADEINKTLKSMQGRESQQGREHS